MAFDFHNFVTELRLVNSSPMSEFKANLGSHYTRKGNNADYFAHWSGLTIISIFFSTLRLFEWSFIFCDNSKCRKVNCRTRPTRPSA